MILHPGAHFGDSPTPVGVGGGGRIEGAPGATPNREPAVVHRSDCSRASPLARADFASSPPRRWHLHTACFTDEAFVSATPEGLRGTRREAGERWEGSEQRGLRRQDGETRDAKRVLKFRRLHLVHSSTVTARQTVAVIALILEFSLSPFMPLAFSLLLFLSLSLLPSSLSSAYPPSLSIGADFAMTGTTSSEKSRLVAIFDSLYGAPFMFRAFTYTYTSKYFCMEITRVPFVHSAYKALV